MYIACSTISNIPYNLICTTKFNDSSILITIISCDYLNLSLADEHVGDGSNINPGNYQVQPKFSPGGLQYSNEIKLFYNE